MPAPGTTVSAATTATAKGGPPEVKHIHGATVKGCSSLQRLHATAALLAMDLHGDLGVGARCPQV